ncbi:hypothetical protein BLA28_17130 [Eisenbergiella tayi]|uniref:DUF3795 domain-containing protein n=1 Tax=Eisenbergiella tayi TaxID=1432052 RepID=A0A1E3AMG9_9FIRM|nr:DUF3795 domain-containing protein [Eisenbergiella tayi]ODM09898.1 hypothetical protein BEH84_04266 [Eisenbergiella tayi]OIZ63618.1 hypothetical protein BLA28_17130 [Eisenbergiella tayi]
MERKELLENIAPCSLMCYTCGGYEKGAICKLAGELSGYLEGMYEFYEKHSGPGQKAYLERFQIFQEELTRMGEAGCGGCRNGEHNGCSIRGCFLLECVKENEVDFCGECPEFPCDKVHSIFEEEVYLQWLEGGKRIREAGAEQFWEERRHVPHYAGYKKGLEE